MSRSRARRPQQDLDQDLAEDQASPAFGFDSALMGGAYGNAFAQERLRGQQGSDAGEEEAFPFQAEIEAAFGEDLSELSAETGVGAELDGLGAEATAEGDALRFADAAPDLETVAHEAAHALQARQSGEGEEDEVSSPEDSAEKEAEAAARKVARGEKATVNEKPRAGVMRKKGGKPIRKQGKMHDPTEELGVREHPGVREISTVPVGEITKIAEATKSKSATENRRYYRIDKETYGKFEISIELDDKSTFTTSGWISNKNLRRVKDKLSTNMKNDIEKILKELDEAGKEGQDSWSEAHNDHTQSEVSDRIFGTFQVISNGATLYRAPSDQASPMAKLKKGNLVQVVSAASHNMTQTGQPSDTAESGSGYRENAVKVREGKEESNFWTSASTTKSDGQKSENQFYFAFVAGRGSGWIAQNDVERITNLDQSRNNNDLYYEGSYKNDLNRRRTNQRYEQRFKRMIDEYQGIGVGTPEGDSKGNYNKAERRLRKDLG